VRRDCHGRTKMDEWVNARGQAQTKPKNNGTELFHDEVLPW